MPRLDILNAGCGANPLLDGEDCRYINLDLIEHSKVIKHDLLTFPYPLYSHSFDRVYFFHCIEHLPEEWHIPVLREFRRLLRPEGELFISYPEFINCAQNFIDCKDHDRDFWKATIYGRGGTEWDRHKALMYTPAFTELLRDNGFEPIEVGPEVQFVYNTKIRAKVAPPTLTYEELLEREFGRSTA